MTTWRTIYSLFESQIDWIQADKHELENDNQDKKEQEKNCDLKRFQTRIYQKLLIAEIAFLDLVLEQK